MPKFDRLNQIFDFIQAIGKLKTTKRFGANDTIEGDSSADHSWRLAMMTFLIAQELKLDVDMLKAVKLALVHDVAESVTGDIDARLIKDGVVTREEKHSQEVSAIASLCKKLPDDLGQEILDLWNEYEAVETPEAKFIKALDKIESLTLVTSLGHQYFDDFELVGTYGNAQVKQVPELSPVMAFMKEKIRKEFKKAGVPWKEEFNDFQ